MAPTGGTRLRMKYAKSKNKLKAKKIPSLKNRIRSLERYLQRKKDPTCADKERELEELLAQLEEKNVISEQKKIVERSKKPRFFERVKLMRKLGKLKKKLEETTSKKEKKKMHADITATRRDLMYVFYFPKSERYIPLFPTVKTLDDTAMIRRETLKAEVVKTYEENIDSHEKFESFCTESRKSKADSTSSCNLIKKPLKVIQKKKKKKHRQNKETNEPALVDQDGSTSELSDTEKKFNQSFPAQNSENEEHDSDFFIE
ncbi:unnamed protein product [Albugo candida]|uniref:rRNA-processing protein EFG1 n=2 Tax=Albugo candida TaxID=65357 RepID=A0A024G1F1_9STRA|nr:unnamed protein product [Albugo candida]|eukprot:CCI40147.1 unnamed protein product [Albugo candida]